MIQKWKIDLNRALVAGIVQRESNYSNELNQKCLDIFSQIFNKAQKIL